MKIAQYFFILIFLFSINSSAQNEINIDTSDVVYRKTIEDYFYQQTAKTEKFITAIPDKKTRKEFGMIYSEKKTDFLKLIRRGFFIQDKKYSLMIENVFQTIKKGNPNEDLDDVKILLALSDEINASNVGDGIVILNFPLILNLDNEFQLAYIMSHEIAHQKLNHVNNSILKRVSMNNSKNIKNQTKLIDKQKYNKGKSATLFLKSIVYGDRNDSRRKEHQADSLGYVYFSKAFPNYKHQALETLKKLKTIDQIKDSLVKKDYINIFEKANNGFNVEWLKGENLNGYNYQKGNKFWEVDSLRTHPDCDTRVSFLINKFKISGNLEKVDTNPFLEIKKDSKKENILNFFLIEEYGKSLYFTLLMLKDNQEDVFLRKMLYQNMMKIRDSRNDYTLNRYLETENPQFSDSYNQYLGFVRNLRKKEIEQILEYYKQE